METVYSLNNESENFVHSTDLFVYPTIWKSIARTMDLWGGLDEYSYSSSWQEADRCSLKSDYYIVMDDINKVTKKHGKQKSRISAN